ncbi:MAG: tyrosine-type recombinase/integrase, partial [Wohlfahrtiimonas sp.]
MARITSPLTLSEIKKAKPKEKAYKLYDGEGLYLSIMPSGKKVWRFDYVDANKKRQTHTIGSFEFVGLNEARQEKFILREKLFRKKNLKHDSENTFNDTFNTWLELWSAGKSESHVSRARNAINSYIVPMIGNINMAEITTRDIVAALEKIDKKGSREILNKTKSALNLCFSYAVAKGICEQNPVMLIDNSVFSRQEKSNFRHLDKHEVYKIHSITDNDGVVISRLCAEFMIRNLTRPNESAGAMWDELNWETGVLTIKNDRMKMKNTHVIPLSNQSIEILNKIKEGYN